MITIFNCQKQDDSISSETYQEKKIKYISFDDFKNEIVQNEYFNSISQYFDTNNLSNKSSKLSKIPDDLILTDNIIKIDKEKGASYTFKLETAIDYNEFYNLIVNVDESGNIEKSQIVEYLPSEEWLTDTEQPFVGHIKISENNIFTNEDILNSKDTTAAKGGGQDSCYETSESWECAAGNEHEPNTCLAGGSTLTITFVQVACDYGGLGGGGIGFPIGGGPNTGVGGTTNPGPGGEDPDTTITSPMPPDDTNCSSIACRMNNTLNSGDSFVFNSKIDSNNSLNFSSVQDFEVHKNNFSFEQNISIEDNQNGTHTTKFRVKYNGITTLNITINQDLKDTSISQNYKVNSLNTIYSGVTIGTSWAQSSYDYKIFNGTAIIDLYGSINYNLFIEGIGTVYTDAKHYQMIVNIQNGQQISITEIND